MDAMYSLSGISALYGREISSSKISASEQKSYKSEYASVGRRETEFAPGSTVSNPDQENGGNIAGGVSEYYRIECVINPCDDLVIERGIQVSFVVSSDYLKDNDIIVTVDDANPFFGAIKANPAYQTHDILKQFHIVRKNGSSSDCASLCFPWLQNSKQKYHIAVWFYAIRNILKSTSQSKYDTPLLVSQNLPKSSELSRRSSFRSTTVSLLCGAGRTRGRRSYMEDVDFFFPNMKVSEKLGGRFSVFGVLDGHGGQDCARYCSEEIPTKIAALLRNGKCPAEALFQSFLETDREFVTSRNDASGSTCSLVLWDHIGSFYIANTGDTRAVLCRSGRAIDLTIDRKAIDPDEIARICEAGGYVANGRVMGSLAVSRALGDAQLKTRAPRPLIADPDITTYTASMVEGASAAMDEFILVATDGLWDVMSSAEAVALVRELMAKSKVLPLGDSGGSKAAVAPKSDEAVASELSKIADYVVNRASKTLGSLDNVTLMIIRIDGLRPSTEDSFDDDFDDNEVNAYSSSCFSRPDSKQVSDVNTVFNDGLGNSTKAATKKIDEDDLMNFLLDDGNF